MTADQVLKAAVSLYVRLNIILMRTCNTWKKAALTCQPGDDEVVYRFLCDGRGREGYRVFNPDWSIVRVSDSRKSINKK
jgi:hypothetical protein